MLASKRIVRNVSYLLSSDIISNAIGLITAILLARVLGTEGFGLYSFAFAFASVMLLFSDFGISPYMIKEIARFKHRAGHIFGSVIALKIVLAILTIVVGFIIINVMEDSPHVLRVVYIALITMVASNFAAVYKNLLQAFETMQYESTVKIIEKVLLLGLLLYLMQSSLTVMKVLLVFLVVGTVVLIILILIAHRKMDKFHLVWDIAVWRRMLIESFPYWLTGVFILIYFKIDTMMLSIFRSFTEVGLYNVSYKLIEGLLFVPTIFVVATYPSMARLYEENRQHLKLLFQKSLKYLTIIAIPMAAGGTVLAQRFIHFIFGPLYIDSYPALQILVWGGMFIFVNYLMGYLLMSVNKQKLFTLTTGISTGVNIVLNLILIPILGFIGAALATVATEFLNFMLFYHFTRREGFPLAISKLVVKPAGAAAVMVIMLLLLEHLHVLILVPAGAILYFLVLILLRHIGREELAMIKHLR